MTPLRQNEIISQQFLLAFLSVEYLTNLIENDRVKIQKNKPCSLIIKDQLWRKLSNGEKNR